MASRPSARRVPEAAARNAPGRAMDPAFEQRLKAIFDEFDDDGGGEIDTEELGKVMEKLGQHCTEAELHVRRQPASLPSRAAFPRVHRQLGRPAALQPPLPLLSRPCHRVPGR